MRLRKGKVVWCLGRLWRIAGWQHGCTGIRVRSMRFFRGTLVTLGPYACQGLRGTRLAWRHELAPATRVVRRLATQRREEGAHGSHL